MSSRIEKMLAKTAGVRSASDIPQGEVQTPTRPKTAVGLTAALQSAQLRIEELEAKGDTSLLPVHVIDPNPWQPRRYFDEQEIVELAESIKEVGLIQPISVRVKPVPNLDTLTGQGSVPTLDTRYELIAGERRLRAHKLIGLSEIKVIVRNATNEDLAVMALAENLDRADLSDYEIAKAIRRAESEFPSRTRMAEAIGIGRTDIYKYLAFDGLPDFIRADLECTPRCLGRAAAEQIASLTKAHGDKAVESLQALWPRVKSGDLDQGKIAGTVEAVILRGETARTERDIRKLFVGKEQAGSITRDANSFTVKIRAAALSPAKEAELRAFVERLFTAG